MLQENIHNVILIGVAEDDSITEERNQNTQNPFSLYTRLHFLRESYGNTENLHIYPLFDIASDEKWVESILEIIPVQESTSIKVYSGDVKYDSAIQVLQKHISVLKGKSLEFIEVSRTKLPISGTEIREDIERGREEELKKKLPECVFERIMKK
jgi:hypothetical protein